MDADKLIEELKRDEGCVLHAYQDHLGYTTIGVGRLLDQRRGGGISQDEAKYLLANDIERVTRALQERVDCFNDLDDVRQRSLVNMAFQLGLGGLLKFKKMLAAMDDKQWSTAANEALDSRWANQTPERAKRIAYMIETGESE